MRVEIHVRCVRHQDPALSLRSSNRGGAVGLVEVLMVMIGSEPLVGCLEDLLDVIWRRKKEMKR